jgi:hypothetical protein
MARICEGKTSSPYPQLRCLYLVEAGTHAGVSVIAAPCQASEVCLARGLLPAIKPGMLVLVDRGFISGALVQAIRARGAHVLGRLAQGVFTHKEQVLPDGSYLTTLDPRNCQGLSAPLQVRIIEYLIDPQVAQQLEQVTPSRMHSGSGTTNPQVRQVHRLITTLLSPEQAPASALCLCYHERWEVEETIDETRNQQRLSQQPLRSRSRHSGLAGILRPALGALCRALLDAAGGPEQGLGPRSHQFYRHHPGLGSGHRPKCLAFPRTDVPYPSAHVCGPDLSWRPGRSPTTALQLSRGQTHLYSFPGQTA